MEDEIVSYLLNPTLNQIHSQKDLLTMINSKNFQWATAILASTIKQKENEIDLTYDLHLSIQNFILSLKEVDISKEPILNLFIHQLRQKQLLTQPQLQWLNLNVMQISHIFVKPVTNVKHPIQSLKDKIHYIYAQSYVMHEFLNKTTYHDTYVQRFNVLFNDLTDNEAQNDHEEKEQKQQLNITWAFKYIMEILVSCQVDRNNYNYLDDFALVLPPKYKTFFMQLGFQLSLTLMLCLYSRKKLLYMLLLIQYQNKNLAFLVPRFDTVENNCNLIQVLMQHATKESNLEQIIQHLNQVQDEQYNEIFKQEELLFNEFFGQYNMFQAKNKELFKLMVEINIIFIRAQLDDSQFIEKLIFYCLMFNNDTLEIMTQSITTNSGIYILVQDIIQHIQNIQQEQHRIQQSQYTCKL